jgi:DNA (cytosine-5)-methyltransferase 1
MENTCRFIVLFCGIGGFHVALASLGGECVFASDIDEKCREVYADNFGLKPSSDITKINAKDIPPHEVLCAGFPCQAFSKAGYRLGLNDTRGTLFFDIVRIVEEHHPKYLILENVRNLLGHDKGNTWKVISKSLDELGYVFQDPPIIFSPHLIGIPQYRERVCILAQRKDLPYNAGLYLSKIKPIRKCSIDDILDAENKYTDPNKYKLTKEEFNIISIWDEFAKGIVGPMPGFPIWVDEFRTKYDCEGLPKWKANFIFKNRQFYKENKRFIDRWLKKHDKLSALSPSRRSFEWQAQESARNLWELIIQFRPSGVRVKRPTYFPGLVAITQTSIVGKLKRKLSPREAARLQSYPDTFKLNADDRIAYKQLGNSVNVEVIKYMASRLLRVDHPLGEQIQDHVIERQQLVLQGV